MSDLLTPQPQRGGARPVLVAGFAEAAWLTPDGRVEMLEPVLAARGGRWWRRRSSVTRRRPSAS